MLTLKWSTPAADEFEHNQNFYQSVNRQAARALAMRVAAAIRQLRQAPSTGRPGLRDGTREWVVPRTPYLLVYRINESTLEILHVFHQRQDWMNYPD